MGNKKNDDLTIEKIEEIDAEIEAFDQERDSKVKEERGKLYEISVLPDNMKILLLVIGFVLISVIFILLAVFAMGQSVFLSCVVMLLNTGIAVLLYRANIYVHLLVVVLQIVAGIILGVTGFMILSAVLYLIATAVILMAEKVNGRYEPD